MAKINKPSIATDTSLLVVGHNRGVGFSEKVNYNSETREQVIKLVLKGEKSAIDTELVKRALSNAIMQRGHHDRLTFHSDRGVQYSSMGYRTMLSENGIMLSMSAAGCPYDNACMESFFASFKKEMAYRRDFKDIEDVREAVFRYIELFYNRKRLHSSLEYMTPVEYRLSRKMVNSISNPANMAMTTFLLSKKTTKIQ
jgi:hypothetical protein